MSFEFEKIDRCREELAGFASANLEKMDVRWAQAETDEESVALASQIPAVSQGGAVEIRPSKVYW